MDNKANSKYGRFLTVIIIISTVALVGLACFFAYQKIAEYMQEMDTQKVIEEFEQDIANIVVLEEETAIENESDTEDSSNVSENGKTYTKKSSGTTKKTTTGTKTYSLRRNYKGFIMVGYIQIPRTGIKLPVLESVSPKALNKSVGILGGPGLNQVGNTTIIGHNYRNRQFFSRNDKIQIGDKIYITDETGTKLEYVVYDKYTTSPEDGTYMSRDTNGEIEISLSSCTNDNSQRIIICARAVVN